MARTYVAQPGKIRTVPVAIEDQQHHDQDAEREVRPGLAEPFVVVLRRVVPVAVRASPAVVAEGRSCAVQRANLAEVMPSAAAASWSFLTVRERCNDRKGSGYPVDRVFRPHPPHPAGYSALTALSSLPSESLASPKSRVVLGSKSSSFSMPAKPGRIERFMKTTCLASSALRIGMP